MNSYVGKICPYCKTKFTEDDEVVVCSECEMPHHKDCWVENQGCTTFGCSGTIDSPNHVDPLAAAQGTEYVNLEFVQKFPHIFCTECGAKNKSTHRFCVICGRKLH